jgi:hypothetical protein
MSGRMAKRAARPPTRRHRARCRDLRTTGLEQALGHRDVPQPAPVVLDGRGRTCRPAPARCVCVSPRLLEGHDHLGHQDSILEQAKGGITELHVNDLRPPLWVRAGRNVRHHRPDSHNAEPELAIPRRGEGTGGPGRRDAGVLTRRDVPARVPAFDARNGRCLNRDLERCASETGNLAAACQLRSHVYAEGRISTAREKVSTLRERYSCNGEHSNTYQHGKQ